jgi:pimeloyl-ACP methyl ester carboxylesterase
MTSKQSLFPPHPTRLLLAILGTWCLLSPPTANADPKPLPGKQSTWNGFARVDFSLDGFSCRVVQPQTAAKGYPWIWRARFWGHQPQTDIALLKHGFHLVYCDVADLWGNQEAMRRWERCYEFLTTQHGFSSRPALEGMSRGGLIIYRWAITHPRCVSCIYGDAPAMGIRPYVKGLSRGAPELKRLRSWMNAHGLSLAKAKSYRDDALDHAQVLARAGVPVIHVCGDADESVPYPQHTAEFARRYRRFRGTIKLIVKKGGKHHPHSLKNPTPIVEFILSHQ